MDEESFSHLVYEKVVYVCVHYGKPRVRPTAKRPNQHYFASGCKARIVVSIDRDAEDCVVLRVKSVNVSHNHELSEKRHGYYPKNRRLSVEETEDAKKLLRLNVKPSDVKATICEATRKLVQTKDILNIALRKHFY